MYDYIKSNVTTFCICLIAILFINVSFAVSNSYPSTSIYVREIASNINERISRKIKNDKIYILSETEKKRVIKWK